MRNLVFAAAWTAASAAICLVSWGGGRLNFIPGLGFSLVVALLLSRIPSQKWLYAFSILFVLCLFANQGTARQWFESGTKQRNLFNYLSNHQEDWKTAEVVFLDTRSLRERQTRGLGETTEAAETWAYFGNASLIRGFVPKSMLQLINPNGTNPVTVIDVECGAYITDAIRLNWHDRWDPANFHITPLTNVFMIDVLECFQP